MSIKNHIFCWGANIKMIALVNSWLDYVSLRCSLATLKTYRSAMQIFIDNLPLKTSPEDITPMHIENFLQVVNQSHKETTTNAYLITIKTFYKWAESYCELPNIATPVTELKVPEFNRRILSDEEYQAVLEKAKGHAHNTIQFLANTGLRRNEFRFLAWADFSAEFVHVIGKGSKTRYVPLNLTCQRTLGKDRSGNAPPFVEKYKPYNSLYKLCTYLSQKANVPYFTPHSFRHFFATRLIKKGVPLMIVSKILGHSSVETTEKIYVHLQADDLKVTDCLSS